MQISSEVKGTSRVNNLSGCKIKIKMVLLLLLSMMIMSGANADDATTNDFDCTYMVYEPTDPETLICKIFYLNLVSNPNTSNCVVPPASANNNSCVPEKNLTFSGDKEQKNNTRILWFQNSVIKFVPSVVFEQFPNLVELRIWNLNESSGSIEKEMFEKIGQLKRLNLGNFANISEDALTPLMDLEVLDLSKNKFSVLLTNIFKENSKIKELYLEHNKLEELGQDLLKNQQQLEIINLSGNQIKMFPLQLFQNSRKLKEIRMSGMSLKHLEKNLLENLEELEILDLSRNELRNIPPEFFITNKKLKEINIGWNHLEELPLNLLSQQGNLENFQAASNNLKNIPTNFFNESLNLKILDIRFNPLLNIDDEDFKSFTSLTIHRGSATTTKFTAWIILIFQILIIFI